MKKPPHTFSTAFRVACAIVLAFVSVLPALLPNSAYAAQITNRSLTLEANGTNGGSVPGVNVNHEFKFTLPTAGTVGSIQFQYCTTAANSPATPACVAPPGLDTTGLGFTNVSGPTWTSVTSTAANSAYISKAAAAISANQVVDVVLTGVKNPTAANQTFFVRISSYASTDTTGSSTDAGTVAASTTNQITVTGTMPESLVFCTGEAVGLTAGVPDCTTATAGAVTFNNLFDPTSTASATSQMAASTNAGFGYAITVNGTTLTSGSNTIAGMATTDTSKLNQAQFGMNLKLNTTPARGLEVAPASNGTNYQGKAHTGYDVANSYTFNSGNIVAQSDQGTPGTPVASDSQIYTVTYIANVPGSQPAGTYVATLTYVCTPTF